jgi:hypothetical protein
LKGRPKVAWAARLASTGRRLTAWTPASKGSEIRAAVAEGRQQGRRQSAVAERAEQQDERLAGDEVGVAVGRLAVLVERHHARRRIAGLQGTGRARGRSGFGAIRGQGRASRASFEAVVDAAHQRIDPGVGRRDRGETAGETADDVTIAGSTGNVAGKVNEAEAGDRGPAARQLGIEPADGETAAFGLVAPVLVPKAS